MFLFTFLPFRKTLFFIMLIVITAFSVRTYLLYKKMHNAPSHQESVEIVIQHKEIFLMLYKLRPIQEFIWYVLYGDIKKSVSQIIEDTIESRIMNYIEQHPEITSVNQLPYLERNILRSLDSSAYLGSMTKQSLSYLIPKIL